MTYTLGGDDRKDDPLSPVRLQVWGDMIGTCGVTRGASTHALCSCMDLLAPCIDFVWGKNSHQGYYCSGVLSVLYNCTILFKACCLADRRHVCILCIRIGLVRYICIIGFINLS